MKFIHTGDWHLGQSFFDYDRKEEHSHFFEWLKACIVEHEVEVMLVAGDVFDGPNPSAESQRVFYRFLREITTLVPMLKIVMIAGNHDSAARLEAPNPLFEDMNVTVRGIVRRTADGEIDYDRLIIPLCSDVCCLAVPYLRQGDYPDAKSYGEGVQKMYQAVYDKAVERYPTIIAMGHLQATGSEVSQDDRSERTIIGGLEVVTPESFDHPKIVYTALGHLHRAQKVSGREFVRYAGTPLPMSFAEKNNSQGVNLVEIGGETKVTRLDFDPPVRLISIPSKPASVPEVMEEITHLPDGEVGNNAPFLEIKVMIDQPEPSLRFNIEEALKGKAVRLTRIVASTPKREVESEAFEGKDLDAISPYEMANEVFRKQYGGEEMPRVMQEMLLKVIQEVQL